MRQTLDAMGSSGNFREPISRMVVDGRCMGSKGGHRETLQDRLTTWNVMASMDYIPGGSLDRPQMASLEQRLEGCYPLAGCTQCIEKKLVSLVNFNKYLLAELRSTPESTVSSLVVGL
ncbi:hypothetical protein SAMN05421858_4482 [Haladaptatus litoreus]|uniref:Uncharacterized protein n=1 Tax=Haladaptatus litoreus TaxID=553468 RepID=A0A1N7ETL8_9EURY|nr:hypothetical protein SAMN05421858_4482 [Haladaptatus litoreus]